jgi:phosphoenolpyruvate synthase/pyruvate phosphate dikinase
MATVADFFSFGTNDLTQMSFGSAVMISGVSYQLPRPEITER